MRGRALQAGVLLGVACFICAGANYVHATSTTTFQFAPPRVVQPESQATAVDSGTQIQLDTISSWGKWIVSHIPESIKKGAATTEAWRIKTAVHFGSLRDVLSVQKVEVHSGPSGKAAPKSSLAAQAQVQEMSAATSHSPSIAYYWYSIVAFYFEYSYVFYGVTLLFVIFILRFILFRLNLVA